MDLKSLKFPLVALGCITLLATQPGASCVDTTTTTDGKTTSQHKVDPNWNDSDSNNNDGHDDNDPNYIPRRADIVHTHLVHADVLGLPAGALAPVGTHRRVAR